MHRQPFLQILKEYNLTANSEEKKVILELIDYVKEVNIKITNKKYIFA